MAKAHAIALMILYWNIVEASWIADIYNNLVSDKFRAPKPISTKDGSWVFNGWTVNRFVEGKHEDGNYTEAIKISKIFHKALIGISKPTFFEKRKDVWSVADKIAWGELPLPDFELTNKPLQRIFSLLKKITCQTSLFMVIGALKYII